MRVWQSETVDPEPLVETDGINHQGFPFPSTRGVSEIVWCVILRMRPAIHIDHAHRVRSSDVDNENALQVLQFDYLHTVRCEKWSRPARRLASRVRFELVYQT